MLIQSYGLFWHADQVNWFPGKGHSFRMLGRRYWNLPHLRVTDFRQQSGIYILYGNHGPHYVGLARKRGIGVRLREHLGDEHKGHWDRFSWFGFRAVLKSTSNLGLHGLKKLATIGKGPPNDLIADTEALLIKAMGLRNKADMKFKKALCWEQVRSDEINQILQKIL